MLKLENLTNYLANGKNQKKAKATIRAINLGKDLLLDDTRNAQRMTGSFAPYWAHDNQENAIASREEIKRLHDNPANHPQVNRDKLKDLRKILAQFMNLTEVQVERLMAISPEDIDQGADYSSNDVFKTAVMIANNLAKLAAPAPSKFYAHGLPLANIGVAGIKPLEALVNGQQDPNTIPNAVFPSPDDDSDVRRLALSTLKKMPQAAEEILIDLATEWIKNNPKPELEKNILRLAASLGEPMIRPLTDLIYMGSYPVETYTRAIKALSFIEEDGHRVQVLERLKKDPNFAGDGNIATAYHNVMDELTESDKNPIVNLVKFNTDPEDHAKDLDNFIWPFDFALEGLVDPSQTDGTELNEAIDTYLKAFIPEANRNEDGLATFKASLADFPSPCANDDEPRSISHIILRLLGYSREECADLETRLNSAEIANNALDDYREHERLICCMIASQVAEDFIADQASLNPQGREFLTACLGSDYMVPALTWAMTQTTDFQQVARIARAINTLENNDGQAISSLIKVVTESTDAKAIAKAESMIIALAKNLQENEIGEKINEPLIAYITACAAGAPQGQPDQVKLENQTRTAINILANVAALTNFRVQHQHFKLIGLGKFPVGDTHVQGSLKKLYDTATLIPKNLGIIEKPDEGSGS